jgi:hypothetical protein
MSLTLAELQIAFELASRLESAMGVRAHVLQRNNEEWGLAGGENQPGEIDPRIQSALQYFDAKSLQPLFLRRDSQLTIIVDTALDRVSPIVVGLTIQDQNDQLVRSLIAAHVEALTYRRDATKALHQTEYFIDQVTQDFEELTWLRNAHEYLDLCDAKLSVGSIASRFLPDLARVIRAESILYFKSDQAQDPENPDISKCKLISSGALGDGSINRDECVRLLKEQIPFLHLGPRVLNARDTDRHLPGFPGLRNCVVIAVSKGNMVYGWLVAANKMASQNTMPPEQSYLVDPNAAQFGTLEAGLLNAAASIMASHARNIELFDTQEELMTGIVRAIINAIDAKDQYTCGHSDRVAAYAKSIAERLGEDPEECERIYMAGLLHDVGKIGVPDSILGKPGKLTDEEYAIVKKHPEIGYSILKHLKQLDYVLPGVLHHHEAIDGSGYPAGLIGDSIPFAGRLLAVADAYDAMTSDRPYRRGMPTERAESILKAEAGTTWDARIVAALMECLECGIIKVPSNFTHPTPPISFADPTYASHPLMNRIALSINSIATV